MHPIRFSIVFNKKNKLNKNGEALVQLVAYKPKSKLATKHKYISTEIYLRPDQWDNANNRVVKHDLEARYNFKLSELLNSYQKRVMDLINRYGKCELQDLIREPGTDYLSFYEFFKSEIRLSSRTKALGTIKTYNSAFVKLKEFRAQMYFSDLTYQNIEGFDSYLASLGLAQTVKAKYHKIVKYMINQAIKKDMSLPKGNPYMKFKIKAGQSKPATFLTQYEVSKIEALQFEPSEMYLEMQRDAFLFCCYTSLRNETNRVLKLSMFSLSNGIYSMTTTSNKTDKHYHYIPISKYFPGLDGISKPHNIIEKYTSILSAIYGERYKTKPIFGKVTNQASNRYLKIIGKRAGLNKVLTTHVARHTFGTFMAGKVPIHVLQAIMQHGSIKTTMQYIHLNEKMISDELDNVKW